MNNPEEVLWEFTLDCNKHCIYCGSKNITNRDQQARFSKSLVADYICKVNPHQVTFTGGEPSTHYDELIQCVEKFHSRGVKSKVLTNGNLFNFLTDDHSKLLTAIGYSVNQIEDIQAFNKHYSQLVHEQLKQKITIVTNFGTHNISMFEKIAKFATQFSCWQVQLTIGNEFQLDLQQIKQLQTKVTSVQNSGLIQVCRADNFNCGKCQAGLKGFSVTFDGQIIPCLSYRCWRSDILFQGVITDIQWVWENRFQFNRTREFVPSCKTISGIEQVAECEGYYYQFRKNFTKLQDTQTKEPATIPPNTVFVYGVATPPQKLNKPLTIE